MLRRRREQIGLSMREAARRIDISPSYLAAIEHGRNPTTNRAPVPSPPILASIGRVFEIDLAALMDASGAPVSSSSHLLLYQAGTGRRSALEAARKVFAGQVDAWIEIIDPRRSDDGESPALDVLIRQRGPLGWDQSAPQVFEVARALSALSDVLADAPRWSSQPRLGIIFGANSVVLRTLESSLALLESETTWEDDVEAVFQSVHHVGAAANVCVYDEADIQELSARTDQLATVLGLIRTHPRVAVQEENAVTTGPAAIETILAAARPAGVSFETWESLTRAAAIGLERAAAP